MVCRTRVSWQLKEGSEADASHGRLTDIPIVVRLELLVGGDSVSSAVIWKSRHVERSRLLTLGVVELEDITHAMAWGEMGDEVLYKQRRDLPKWRGRARHGRGKGLLHATGLAT